jgi:acetoin utilization deacetylase AcuC-like enzyme
MLTLFDHLLEVEGIPASRDDLQLAHTPGYIARVERRSREAAERGEVLALDGQIMVSGASWEAARAAVGCALTAVERVGSRDARNAFCAVRPPGHGAGPDSAGGFAIFNAVAVAAIKVIRAVSGRRVLVVEWGSRPGSGTASILASEPAARFVSLHLDRDPAAVGIIPSAFTRPLPHGSGLAELLAALRGALDEATRDFTPSFVLLSLGCDALEGDPLGGFSLTPKDYFDLTVELSERADDLCEGRLVSVLEEGYDAEASARAVVQHLRALAGLDRA